METNCGSLLRELQNIWDDVGESDSERDKMLLELEQECLNAYKRKVDQANRRRAQLRQTIADAESQLADIYAALGDRPVHINKSSGSLKKELQEITPQLEAVKRRRDERKSQFAEVLRQINCISMELSGSKDGNLAAMVVDEHDLSTKKLDDLRAQLLLLEKEKSERLEKVVDQLNVLNSLCMVLGTDFKSTLCSVNPTLDSSFGMICISGDTIKSLSTAISGLKDVKLQRMQRLQELAMTMVELWNLMDTPVEEQRKFQNVTRTIAAAVHEITEPNSLSLDFINKVEAEVASLQELKMSKIKEVILRKKEILKEICQGAHMVVDRQFGTDSLESIESGAVSPSYILDQLELQISKVKEEACSRKEILEKVQKWMAAREEECWLEEYNRDDNRYNAGRGTHLMLKRAEKARVIVNKIPAMVDALKSKVKAWEKERTVEFLYDGVGLMTMIGDYCELQHLKEQERQKQRDQKKLQGQLMAEKEAIFGSKPSPSQSANKNFRPSIGGGALANKRFSLGGAMLQNMVSEKPHPSRNLTKNKNNSTLKRQPCGKAKVSKPAEISNLRRALSPISSLCSNIISCDSDDVQEKNVSQAAYKTPTKNVGSVYDAENRTPRTMGIPVPCTPPTVSNVMQMAMTPFTPGCGVVEDVEYSFEEVRAGFVVPVSSHFRPRALV